MSTATRISARWLGDSAGAALTEVRLQMSHPMETGRRRDENGLKVPAWYITEVEVRWNGQVVLAARFGTAVSRDPYLRFRFPGGAPGTALEVRWRDSRGEAREDTALIA